MEGKEGSGTTTKGPTASEIMAAVVGASRRYMNVLRVSSALVRVRSRWPLLTAVYSAATVMCSSNWQRSERLSQHGNQVRAPSQLPPKGGW
jgi:hypothetical protein